MKTIDKIKNVVKTEEFKNDVKTIAIAVAITVVSVVVINAVTPVANSINNSIVGATGMGTIRETGRIQYETGEVGVRYQDFKSYMSN